MASSSTSGHANIPAPPPPTPSNQTLSKSLSADADAALSRFLHQLSLTPKSPSLSSPPSRLSKQISSPPPPLVSLNQPHQDFLLSAATDLGFFHLTSHSIPSHLPYAAVLQSQSFLQHPTTNKNLSSLGFDHDDDNENNDNDDDRDDDNENNDNDDDRDQFRVFEANSSDLEPFLALAEYAKSMEKVALEVVEMIFPETNPFNKGTIRPRCLICISSSSATGTSKCTYPHVVCLEYEMKWWKKPCCVLGESGHWSAFDPCADSVLVTLGDISQVWSNGRFKKVRGRPQPGSLPLENCGDSANISVSLMVTLPMDSMVSPLALKGCALLIASGDGDGDGDDGDDDDGDNDNRSRYREFSFDEYAWRVYHERLPYKDPLLRYQI